MPLLVAFLTGCFFFPGIFHISLWYLQKKFVGKLSNAQCYSIALRFVSSFQGITACIVGVVIISNTYQDVLDQTHWLANTYCSFASSYFYYDSWAMYVTYWYKRKDHSNSGKPPHPYAKYSMASILDFIGNTQMMMLHHLLLPLILVPIILFLRNDKGDFFLGCLLEFEVGIPFVSLRAVLLELRREKSITFMINGVCSILSFVIFRVLVFPFMYWCYGKQYGLSVIQVPFHIPLKCTFSCLCLMGLQLYYIFHMLKVAGRTIAKYYAKEIQTEPTEENHIYASS